MFTTKEIGNDKDILFTFNLIEPSGYMINIILTNVSNQTITKNKLF